MKKRIISEKKWTFARKTSLSKSIRNKTLMKRGISKKRRQLLPRARSGLRCSCPKKIHLHHLHHLRRKKNGRCCLLKNYKLRRFPAPCSTFFLMRRENMKNSSIQKETTVWAQSTLALSSYLTRTFTIYSLLHVSDLKSLN